MGLITELTSERKAAHKKGKGDMAMSREGKIPSMAAEQSMPTQVPEDRMMQGGHLYMTTNEVRNSVIHYLRAPDGTITEMERCLTGGAGSGGFNYSSTPIGLIVEGAQASSSHRTDASCSLSTPATIPSPVSASVKAANSRCWMSS